MTLGKDVWRIEIGVPAAAVATFEFALEPYCDSLSLFSTDTDTDTHWRMEGFSRTEPNRSSLGVALSIAATAYGLETPEVHISQLPARDWVSESLRNLPPIPVGRFFIHGSHYEGEVPAGAIGLLVDAGRAFGSGQHQTTAGCLLALDGLARRRFTTPLDMGCGSGVLALAMAKVWRVTVTAVDNDPQAVQVTAANARRNRVGGRVGVVRGNGFNLAKLRRRGPFDLIVSNILADPLCRMAFGLVRHLERGGVVVLSGFLERDANRVFAAYQRLGLRLIRRITVGGWQTLVLKKPGV